MWRILLHITLLFGGINITSAQFAPAAGQPNSTAIRHDSSCFVSWATEATILRGWRNIQFKDSGFSDVGNEEAVIGPALKNGVASLGDSGIATLYFKSGIVNGDGYDFAVFENAFNDSFLELAHVEISANGKDFFRFPSQSLSPHQKQTGAFDATYPTHIDNLAGKYRMPFGTPFDIEDLRSSIDSTDLPSIFYYVRIIDVVGSLDSTFGTTDSKGRMINDPFPTPFPSSGFDLDAIGVIHPAFNNQTLELEESLAFHISQEENKHQIKSQTPLNWLRIIRSNGQEIWFQQGTSNVWEIRNLAPGNYIIQTPSGSKLWVIP